MRFFIALKRTTAVASLTTPSPNTRLYNLGVSSWFMTCVAAPYIKNRWKLNKYEEDVAIQNAAYSRPAMCTRYLLKRIWLPKLQLSMGSVLITSEDEES